ncbi:hypothetical protein AVEN_221932-1 [Araneus ventricosus]|uniref:Uncharacterized protein n=1 Tax=Araneus ventricosus TaxID=182803 RepID=A0A4Y2F7L9_ARAVE|nr:hypothetical protein AVEN_221932-1 [Araneus ventricosus]
MITSPLFLGLLEDDYGVEDSLRALLGRLRRPVVEFLCSIPESYENLRIAIESRDELPSPETLKIKLIEEANARKNKVIPNIHDSQRSLYTEKKKYECYRQTECHQPDADGRRTRNTNQKFKLNVTTAESSEHKAIIFRKKQVNKNLMLNINKSFKNISAMLAEPTKQNKRSKDEVKSAFLEFKAYIENKLNCKIKTLRTKGLSYSDENRVYKLFDSQAQNVITSRDVKFINELENTSNYEELFFPEIIPKKEQHLPDIMDSDLKGTIQSETQKESHPPSNDQITDYPYIVVGISPKESRVSDIDGDCTINVDARRAHGRPTKIFTGKPGRPRKQYNIKEEIEEAQILLEDDIPSVKEAFNGSNSEEWLEAMLTEYNALLKNQDLRLVK